MGCAALLSGCSCQSEAPSARTRGVAAASLQKQTSARFDQILPIAGGLRLTRGDEALEWKIGESLPLPSDHHSSGQLILRSVETQIARVDYQLRIDARSFGKGTTEDEGSFDLPCRGASAPPDLPAR